MKLRVMGDLQKVRESYISVQERGEKYIFNYRIVMASS